MYLLSLAQIIVPVVPSIESLLRDFDSGSSIFIVYSRLPLLSSEKAISLLS